MLQSGLVQYCHGRLKDHTSLFHLYKTIQFCNCSSQNDLTDFQYNLMPCDCKKCLQPKTNETLQNSSCQQQCSLPLFLVLILWPVSVGFATFWLIRIFAATEHNKLYPNITGHKTQYTICKCVLKKWQPLPTSTITGGGSVGQCARLTLYSAVATYKSVQCHTRLTYNV